MKFCLTIFHVNVSPLASSIYTICLVGRQEYMEIDDAMFIHRGVQVVSILFGIVQYVL